MAILPTDWKMSKCLEWHTYLPLPGRQQTSPAFFYQNVECYFCFFRIDFKNYKQGFFDHYELYLKTKGTDTELTPFSFIVYATDHGDRFTRHSVSFSDCNKYVFRFSEAPFKRKPVDLPYGYPFKYIFVFDNDDLLLPSEITTEEKCIQTGSYLNGNVSSESLPDDFSKLLESGSKHDVEMKCGERSLKAHKDVLCSRSEVFKKMLQSDLLEGRTAVVEIRDMKPCYFRDFMHYLYTGTIPELTYDKAKALYEAGDKYAVRSLMLRCSEYLQDILSVENVFDCYVLSDAHSDQNLKGKIKTYILDKKVFLEDEYWEPFCETFPKFANEVYRMSYKKQKLKKSNKNQHPHYIFKCIMDTKIF